MNNQKNNIVGLLLFIATSGFNVIIGILIYDMIKELDRIYIALIILGLILLSALVCFIIDWFRRKIMIEKPLKEILSATSLMARGNFNIFLETKNRLQDGDGFNVIKKDLNRLALDLSKNEVLKNDFIATISHEIKTPVAVINNYITLLSDENLTEEQRKSYLESMHKALDKLNHLLMDVLKLNKLENQKLLPVVQKVNLSEVLAEEILNFELAIDEKEIELECLIEDDIFLASEESYLRIIISNLLSNAIKFSYPKGKIIVELTKNDKQYIIAITDFGLGMSKEVGEHIFDKFYQADTLHHKEGNGLGLALVKKVLDVIGGAIEVESELGKGSKFIVTVRDLNE